MRKRIPDHSANLNAHGHLSTSDVYAKLFADSSKWHVTDRGEGREIQLVSPVDRLEVGLLEVEMFWFRFVSFDLGFFVFDLGHVRLDISFVVADFHLVIFSSFGAVFCSQSKEFINF